MKNTIGRTFYESSIEDFVLNHKSEDIIDKLLESDESSDLDTLRYQKSAWINQVKILKKYLKDKSGYIIFEYI